MNTVDGRRLTISSLTLRTAPFRERVRAAASAGFEGVGLSVEDYLTACRDGLDDETMGTILDDHGVAITEVEFLSDWVPSAGASLPSPKETTAFHIARTFGADHVNVGLFDKTPMELMADSFTALCERAGELKIALEFMPFGGVSTLGVAWELVSRSDRSNAGLIIDVWHWIRGGTQVSDLSPIPADRIFSLQLCDVGPDALADMRYESLHHRLAPSIRTGHAHELLAILIRHGFDAELSAEVMSDALLSQGFDVTAEAVFAGSKEVLADYGWSK